jgi:tRNA pseudouridine55 synthase
MDTSDLSGFMLVNKPDGPTSHDIINRLRSITGIKKIGHAGTLDPFAEGLLIVAVGRSATREIRQFVKMDKIYEVLLRLGRISDTHDRTGKIQKLLKGRLDKAGEKEIDKVLVGFTGAQEQVPPMFSAKKVKGRKLYQLARQGHSIEREPVEIMIKKLERLEYNWPWLKLRVECSSGTYIRALGRDIGQALGVGAYLHELKRTAIGGFKLSQAVRLHELDACNWQDYVFWPV